MFTCAYDYAILRLSFINRNKYMKVLAVKFSDTQVLRIKDTVEVVGIDASKVARAAMRLGLNQINAMAARDIDKAVDLVLINDARSK